MPLTNCISLFYLILYDFTNIDQLSQTKSQHDVIKTSFSPKLLNKFCSNFVSIRIMDVNSGTQNVSKMDQIRKNNLRKNSGGGGFSSFPPSPPQGEGLSQHWKSKAIEAREFGRSVTMLVDLVGDNTQKSIIFQSYLTHFRVKFPIPNSMAVLLFWSICGCGPKW